MEFVELHWIATESTTKRIYLGKFHMIPPGEEGEKYKYFDGCAKYEKEGRNRR